MHMSIPLTLVVSHNSKRYYLNVRFGSLPDAQDALKPVARTAGLGGIAVVGRLDLRSGD